MDFDPVASAKHILTAYLGGSLTIKETERSLHATRSSFNLPHTIADIIDQMDILVGLAETRSDKEMDLLENALRSQIRLILKKLVQRRQPSQPRSVL